MTAFDAIALPPPPTDIPITSSPQLGLSADEQGPPGTVPILRLDTDQFLDNINTQRSVADFLSKYGRIEPPSSSAHFHVIASQTISNIGGDAGFEVTDGATEQAADFSLGQFWLQNFTSGWTLQSVEGCWQHYQDLYGDYDPHFTIYYTTNGYASNGDEIGGFNTVVTGWTQWSSTFFPGSDIGPAIGLLAYMRVVSYGGCYWIWESFSGEYVGCYPASLFGSSGLGTNVASTISWGGEVYKAESGTTTTDMGNGAYADQAGAAIIQNIRVQDPVTFNMNPFVP